MKQQIKQLGWALCLLTIGAPSMEATAKRQPAQTAQVLWYIQPAEDWMSEALPIGNGRIGAMIFGGVDQEHLQFNDKTLWTGSRTEGVNYQNFGDLYLDFDHDKVAVSSKVESRLGVKAGDSITFTVGVNRYTAEIAEIFEAFTFHGVVLYGDAPFLGEAGTYTGIYLNAAPDVSEDQLAEAASETIGGVSSTQTSEDMMSYVGEIMASALQLTGAIKAFAILLAIVVLYNLALLNFRERQRDIATLKVLGFSRAEIALSLLFETMLLTLVGVVVGMLLGFPFMYGVLITNQVEIAQFIYYISPLTYFISFLLTFVVAFAINFFFAIRSEKVKMVDSLKSVE